MNKLFIAATLAAASFSALADGARYEYPRVMTSDLTRAEVHAQAVRAVANGEIASGEQGHVAPATGQALSRHEVLAALDQARRNDELARGEFAYAAKPSTKPAVLASR